MTYDWLWDPLLWLTAAAVAAAMAAALKWQSARAVVVVVLSPAAVVVHDPSLWIWTCGLTSAEKLGQLHQQLLLPSHV